VWCLCVHLHPSLRYLFIHVLRRRTPIRTIFPYTTLFRSHIAGEQFGGVGVGPGDEDGGHAHHIGGEAGGHQVPNRLLGRDEHLRSEEHTSELQSRENLVCRLLLEKKNESAMVLVFS